MNAPNPTPTDHATTDRADLEHRYYQYLRDNAYASTEALIGVLRWYLPYFDGFARVLDIGCGHGEFLQLLQEQGHTAVGIDLDPAMVATCRERGLTAYEGDAIAWLQQQAEPFDAIFSSNVIEHLAAPTVQALIGAAHNALRPGGLLLIGTPNPESLVVQFHEFWRDPTHVRLYSRQLVEFFFADAGFAQIKNGNNAAAAWNGIDELLTPLAPNEPPTALTAAADNLPTLPPLHPLPAPPATDAPLRRRLAFRLLHFVYQKFLEPYVALLRLDQAQQQQQLQALQTLASQLYARNRTLEATVAQITTRLDAVGGSFHFMHPPREHFVYGYKATDAPEAPPSQPAQE